MQILHLNTGEWVSQGYFSLSLSPSATVMIMTALQSVKTEASEQSEAWLRTQRRWSSVWWKFVLGEFASLPPPSTGVTVPIIILRTYILNVALCRHGNLVYDMGKSLYGTTGISLFLYYHYDFSKNVGKIGFGEVTPNLQTSVNLLNLSKLCLYFFTLVPAFEGFSGCLIAKSSGFSHPHSHWSLDTVAHNLIVSGFSPLLTCVILYYS